MRKLLLAISLLIAIATISCEEIETYSEEPRVEFMKVYLADTLDDLQNNIKLQRIHVQIIDGDGNVGLNRDENTGVHHPDSIGYNNLFISVFNKKGAHTYEELSEISENLKYRIPYKEPIGQNKYMKAEVIVNVEIPIQVFQYDTIRYEFFIYDRDMNKSEIATSCDIPTRIHGTVEANGNVKLVKEPEEEKDKKE